MTTAKAYYDVLLLIKTIPPMWLFTASIQKLSQTYRQT